MIKISVILIAFLLISSLGVQLKQQALEDILERRATRNHKMIYVKFPVIHGETTFDYALTIAEECYTDHCNESNWKCDEHDLEECLEQISNYSFY